MSNIIEKVAYTLEEEYEDYMDNVSSEERNSADIYAILAKAAVEALNIIILPADAEPEVGDLISIKFIKPYVIVEENKYTGSLSYKETIDAMSLHHEIPLKAATFCVKNLQAKIIQRNGKPVIQEE